MSSLSVNPRALAPRTLSDVIPGGLARDVLLVLGGTGLVATSALVSIPLPFTPVPLTLQSFAVLLAGAALGSRRGVASLALYVLVGMAGVPWFADHASGYAFASFGYLVGFVVAAAIVGRLAELGADRTPLRTFALMALGTLAIYAGGVPGLMIVLGLSLPAALAAGVVPFLVGDAIKALLAAGLLPGAWRLVGRRG